jgi:hypothetical protein
MSCDPIHERMAEGGPGLPERDPELRAHIAGCPSCAAFQASLAAIDHGFAAMPPIDAGNTLVARTLASAAARRAAPPPPRGGVARVLFRRFAFAASTLAAAALLVVVATNVSQRRNQKRTMSDLRPFNAPVDSYRAAPKPMATPAVPIIAGQMKNPEPADVSAGERDREEEKQLAARPSEQIPAQLGATIEVEDDLGTEVADFRPDADASSLNQVGDKVDASKAKKEQVDDLAEYSYGQDGNENTRSNGAASGVFADERGQDAGRAGTHLSRALGKDARTSATWSEIATTTAALADAERFLADREMVKGLRLAAARGYWANTYLPGDPAMRQIAELLRSTSPAALALAESIERNRQPFDPPASGGLALTLHADRNAVSGPTRVLLQIGLKGAPRTGGIRAPMSLGVVLDLRTAPAPGDAAALRALLDSLAALARSGDRFFLVAAGRPGGLVVTPAEFRSGPLTVALQRLLADPAGTNAFPPDTPALDLAAALRLAATTAGATAEPDAPLGGASVLLVTAAPIGAPLRDLARVAHTAALSGVSTSVVALGSGAPLAEVDRLALAGHGNRRILLQPAEAQALAERELNAASGVVARAVRINVKLGKDVSLVGIPGSHRLDRAATRQVRAAERSIDRSLAASLGLAADRGRDDDGIQFVIPAYQAGDEHVVLLDLVVPGPGSVADVTVRYKDVAALRNGIARASLALAPGRSIAGPLERNVLKNLIARRVADDLTAAAAAAAADPAAAVRHLRATAALLAALRARIPGLGADAEILADERFLATAAARLEGGGGEPLADALRYAAFRKLSPARAPGGQR